MYILGLETTGKYGSAAVINSDGKIYSTTSNNEMNHLQDIIAISDKTLNLAGISKADLTHIACSVGPGSFTGIRIGVTTARTLSQFLNLPTVPVSTLLAMAERCSRTALSSKCPLILSTINARRHQTYAGLYRIQTNTEKIEHSENKSQTKYIESVSEERQYMIEEILEIAQKTGEKIYITGDGIDAYQGIIEETLEAGRFVLSDESLRYQSAESIVTLAYKYVNLGQITSYDKLLPNYMRLSEAEQNLKAGTLSSKISK